MADRQAPDPAAPIAEALERAEAERDAWAQDLFESNRYAADLVVERQNLRDELEAVRARERRAAREDADREIALAHRDREQAQLQRDAAVAERDRAQIAANDATAMLERVTSSTFWRATGPARRVLDALLGR